MHKTLCTYLRPEGRQTSIFFVGTSHPALQFHFDNSLKLEGNGTLKGLLLNVTGTYGQTKPLQQVPKKQPDRVWVDVSVPDHLRYFLLACNLTK